MTGQEYMKMLYVIGDYYEGPPILIQWDNGLKVKCRSFTGITETDTEPGEPDYIGEYSIGVNEVEVMEEGTDDTIGIYEGSIEISLLNIPEKVMSEDGTVLWQREA